MPQFNDISSIPLDVFESQKNPNKMFVYFNFPSQGIAAQFQNMTFDSANKYAYNVLNYTFQDPTAIISIAVNGNFTTANLQTFSPIAFQITQKIHVSNAMTTSTKDDLQMIIQCNPISGGNSVLFLHIMLTNDIKNQKKGGDFNTLFNVLKSTDQINTNTLKFQTDNLKPIPTKLNFYKAISDQLVNDGISSNEPYMFCFYYQDSQNNFHVLLQKPIPISDPNFALIQKYYQEYGLAQNPLTLYSNSNLTPTTNNAIVKDVLLFSNSTLAVNQNTTPMTAEDYEKEQSQKKADDATSKNVQAANKAEPFSTKEGLKTMNCRVANTSDNLVATLVGNAASTTSNMDAYQLITSMVALFICFVVSATLIKWNMFLIPINKFFKFFKDSRDLLVNNFITLKPQIFKSLYDGIKWRIMLNRVVGVIIHIVFIIMLILALVKSPNSKDIIPADSKWIAFIIPLICVIIYWSFQAAVKIFNQRDPSRYNRYPFADKIMNEYISNVYNNKELKKNDAELLDLEHSGKNDDINTIKLNFFRFAHQLMSFYYGDSKWYSKTENDTIAKDNMNTINSIKEIKEKNKIIIEVGGIEYTYSYDSGIPTMNDETND